jgi:hypothetical protein
MGCGARQPIAAYLIERGFSVRGVDSSKTMIAMLQARLRGQEALISDMRTLALSGSASKARIRAMFNEQVSPNYEGPYRDACQKIVPFEIDAAPIAEPPAEPQWGRTRERKRA